MDIQRLEKMGKEIGFSRVAQLDAGTIRLLPEVRQMCEKNSCGMYGNSWSCPPACGSLEDCAKKLAGYQRGILVQTTGQLEDELDGETMMETEALHKQNFLAFHDALIKEFPSLLSLGAGTCTRCKKCTYPDAPCRFPEKRFSSMEAYGMLVTQICQDNHVNYYYGPCTITYTSCFLLE